jgi:hypothetical protein
MKRLSLEELKAQKATENNSKVQQNLESINGGDVDWCHLIDMAVFIMARNLIH